MYMVIVIIWVIIKSERDAFKHKLLLILDQSLEKLR